MRLSQRTQLAVASETLDAAEIAALVGMAADHLVHRGSRSLDPPRPPTSAWCLDATPDRPVDEQIAELLDRIAPVADRLRQVLRRDDVDGMISVARRFGDPDGQAEELTVIGDMVKLPQQHQLLGISLDLDLLARLVDLRLSLDLDEYA